MTKYLLLGRNPYEEGETPLAVFDSEDDAEKYAQSSIKCETPFSNYEFSSESVLRWSNNWNIIAVEENPAPLRRNRRKK